MLSVIMTVGSLPQHSAQSRYRGTGVDLKEAVFTFHLYIRSLTCSTLDTHRWWEKKKKDCALKGGHTGVSAFRRVTVQSISECFCLQCCALTYLYTEMAGCRRCTGTVYLMDTGQFWLVSSDGSILMVSPMWSYRPQCVRKPRLMGWKCSHLHTFHSK